MGVSTQTATGLPGSGTLTNAMLANMAQSTFKGRAAAAGTGVPVDLTVAQAQAILSLATTTTDNAAIRADGTAGGTQNSGVIIDDSVNITGVAKITVTSISNDPTSNPDVAGTDADYVSSSASAKVGISIFGSSTAARTAFQVRNSNGIIGTIVGSASATAYNTSSDYRLKCDVEPLVTFTLDPADFDFLPDTLRKIMAANPVSHRWKADPDGPIAHGFIAHELQQVFPNAVSGEKDAGIEVGTAILAFGTATEPTIDGAEPRSIESIPQANTPEGWEWVAAGEWRVENVKQHNAPAGSEWIATGIEVIPQGVDYSKLVADLTAAVQELTLIVLDQRKQLAAMKGI